MNRHVTDDTEHKMPLHILQIKLESSLIIFQ